MTDGHLEGARIYTSLTDGIPRQQGSASAYLFGAVCPGRGEGVALVLPEVSTAAMDLSLAELERIASRWRR